ncbi:MAG: adenylate/guanylate cyclase domain-containing protein [Aeromicrobium sp.]
MRRNAEAYDIDTAIDALTQAVLGQPVTLTRLDLAKRTGVSPEDQARRWRMLGYPETASDVIAFTSSDIGSLLATQRLVDLEIVEEASEEAFIRTLGRTFSRLAEWQVRVLLHSLLESETGPPTEKDLRRLGEMLQLGAEIQENVWRHHLLGAATRLMVQHGAAPDSEPACVGFVDIVGFTSRSRSLTGAELGALVDRFESVVSDLIADHAGRVVKTIGDEVVFVVDDPVEAAWLAVELAEQHTQDATFPNVRVGMAYGEILNRLGDVLGPVVNMASRLTQVALPGRSVIDSTMAEHVAGTPGLRLRKLRRMNVKGFDSVEPWLLKPAHEHHRGGLRGAFENILEDAADGIAMRLPQL